MSHSGWQQYLQWLDRRQRGHACRHRARALPYGIVPTLSVANNAMLALSVGGTGWQAADVGNLISTNSGGFTSGSVFGLDTTGAAGGFSYGSAITGSMGLAKLGPNALTLSGTNRFTGNTIVAAGTLVATNPSTFSSATSSATLAVSNGATLMLDVGGWGGGKRPI